MWRIHTYAILWCTYSCSTNALNGGKKHGDNNYTRKTAIRQRRLNASNVHGVSRTHIHAHTHTLEAVRIYYDDAVGWCIKWTKINSNLESRFSINNYFLFVDFDASFGRVKKIFFLVFPNTVCRNSDFVPAYRLSVCNCTTAECIE